jgi:hypothetical protein
LDTGGNVFGGFTPLQWESREWNGKYGDLNNDFEFISMAKFNHLRTILNSSQWTVPMAKFDDLESSNKRSPRLCQLRKVTPSRQILQHVSISINTMEKAAISGFHRDEFKIILSS